MKIMTGSLASWSGESATDRFWIGVDGGEDEILQNLFRALHPHGGFR